ncbi:uncharacterized protein EV420DRAFT_616322 [Desarmillaria tabescens]|uniref:Uncharacterized protein n=1 Tax=Armillaria tabescens TaxID=1929756 RepID=A0AA39K3V0_ARMTA|nr:uncharacterized protein EV420DRAFT_616322 [Desarmillaria tabescens]KAK0454034.1 hypothetical protein EV420DRAFT_616322 [Desarmillaria tabescens]
MPQADIPPDLTDENIDFLFQYLDAQLNTEILYALLHGIYTGIIALTLWNIFINKRWPIRRALIVVIIILHALTTINFAGTWSSTRSSFIVNGQHLWTAYLGFVAGDRIVSWVMGISASIGTILSDLYMIWCCWMVWGRHWLVVLLPIISLISATASKILAVYHQYSNGSSGDFLTPYTALTLVTTLWCTLLIIYRILTVAGIGRGAEGRLRFYHCFIEVLVQSSALYSTSLILYLALATHDHFGQYYLDAIASIARLCP